MPPLQRENRKIDAYDFTLQSVLKLLSNFLNQVKQQQLPYNPSNPRMLRGARVAVEWGGNNNTSRQRN